MKRKRATVHTKKVSKKARTEGKVCQYCEQVVTYNFDRHVLWHTHCFRCSVCNNIYSRKDIGKRHLGRDNKCGGVVAVLTAVERPEVFFNLEYPKPPVGNAVVAKIKRFEFDSDENADTQNDSDDR